jgi:hypothetical protein
MINHDIFHFYEKCFWEIIFRRMTGARQPLMWCVGCTLRNPLIGFDTNSGARSTSLNETGHPTRISYINIIYLAYMYLYDDDGETNENQGGSYWQIWRSLVLSHTHTHTHTHTYVHSNVRTYIIILHQRAALPWRVNVSGWYRNVIKMIRKNMTTNRFTGSYREIEKI